MAADLFPSPHPTPSPLSAEDELAWLRLLRSRRVGVSTFYKLLTEYGSAQTALEALPDVARAAGVKNYQICPLSEVEEEIQRGKDAGARLIFYGHEPYPAQLAEIPDAPPFLWVQGDPSYLNKPMIAVAGARNASSLGLRMARRLAKELTEANYVVVSGLARGIDTMAHEAALENGRTVAVMPGGVDLIYPSENADLAHRIAENGVLASEQPVGLSPHARHFPMRNRIISGLSQAVVVVEAAAKSGTLITARNALDQGRDVLAVPGHPFDARAAGCNMLIRDGATLVRHSDDVFDALRGAFAQTHPKVSRQDAAQSQGPSPAPHVSRNLPETSKLHDLILARLGTCPLAEDQLIQELGHPAQELSAEIVSLELEGRITRAAGGLLSRS
ncbi:DNA-processing protein DprA [Aliiroseovarius sp. KMU-50]|uniref:DNA-processing protein DprA n=1 Tax=Aliiroseovarius salicola TaxID=3009082 RepID=A0ABT4W1G1_9RHOB|nr:DNA-processing protein DprA [Aliiroseovarius sp. KMU-50]MDA5093835.1 DNA-processing protein DprA [Aliiroseovarius sp. KMU-50]